MPRDGKAQEAKQPRDDKPISPSEAETLFFGLQSEPAIILAVSGGPDSTALMWLAAQWRKRLKTGPKLVAVTIDHGLRKESRAEARDVKKLAASLGVAHETLRWSGKKPARGIPAAARDARYSLLVKIARKTGARHVLTAHTRDDQAETVLMRLVRGSGVSGLAGMRGGVRLDVSESEFVVLERPLLGIAKARLVATLKAAKVAYADDPTNRDATFTRARLRMSMPILAREGLTTERLVLLADRVLRAEIALYEAVNAAQQRLAPAPWSKSVPIEMELDAFGELPDEIKLRLIGRAIDWLGNEGPVELGKLETLCEALEDATYDWWLKPKAAGRFRRTLAGAVVTASRGKLTIEPAPPRRTPRIRP
jgi:tRNA(Ile)-lysidine synthase